MSCRRAWIYSEGKILKVLVSKPPQCEVVPIRSPTPRARSPSICRRQAGRIHQVVLSTQHDEKSRNDKVYSAGMVGPDRRAVDPCCRSWMPTRTSDFLVNPTGNFVIGGPHGDCGLTGRKIIVDTYGGARRTAAAPSPARTRPRSTARPPMPRAIRQEHRRRRPRRACEIQLAYAIGVPIRCPCWSTPTARARSTRRTREGFAELFRLTPTNIRRTLKLNRPIYRAPRPTAISAARPTRTRLLWEKPTLAAG